MKHVHLTSVVEKGTQGRGVLESIAIHAHMTGRSVMIVNLDTN